MLLPDDHTTMRGLLEAWFDQTNIEPVVVAEFGDSALLQAFGQEGAGIFPAPSAIQDSVIARYGVRPLGELEGIRERFYAITMDKHLGNAAVRAIVDAAELTLSV